MATVGTPFREILLAMKAVIVDNNLLPDGDCYIAVRMNPPAQDQRKAFVIVPLYQTADPKSQEGAGRCGTLKNARINVYYRHQTAVDQSYQDDEWAAGEGGYYDLIDKLEDTFDLWHPRRVTDGSFLLTEPAKLKMDNEPRKKYAEHTEGEGMIELEVIFKAYRTIS